MANKNVTLVQKDDITSGKIPLTTDLLPGELATNSFDGKVYLKKNDGAESIVEISGDKLPLSGGTMTGDVEMAPATSINFDNATHIAAAIGITENYNVNLNEEFVITADDIDDAGNDALGLRLRGNYAILDAPQLAINVPGSEQGSRLISAGTTANGETVLGWEPPPIPGYEVTATGNTNVAIGPGATPTVWVELTTAMTLTQDIGNDEGYFAYQVNLENITTNRDGTIALGLGLNGIAPLIASITNILGPDQTSIFSGTVTNTTSYITGDTLSLYARVESSSNTQFGANALGLTRPTTLKLTIAGEGGSSGVPEAPINGTPYSRQDAIWVNTINKLSQDLIPQLGGNLDVNSNVIKNTTGDTDVEINGNLSVYSATKSGAGANVKFNIDPGNVGGNTGFSFRKNDGGLGGDFLYFENDKIRLRSVGTFELQTFGNNFNFIGGGGVIQTENYTFPNADGTSNQVLTTDGLGNLSFSTPSAGGVTEVAAGSGISVGTGTGPTATVNNIDRGSDQLIFKNVAVSGQGTIVADQNNDTLTFEAGANITLTTDTVNDKLTINAASGFSSSSLSGEPNATATNSIAIGSFANSGEYSIAVGNGCSAPGTNGGSVAIGLDCSVSANTGDGSNSTGGIAIGNGSNAWGGSLAIGNGANANTVSGICVGSSTIESGAWNTLVFGHFATIKPSAGGSIILGIGHGDITEAVVRAGDGFGGSYTNYGLGSGKFRLVNGSAQFITPPHTTSGRPGNAEIGSNIFDTNLGKPIWFSGSNWVDAMGTIV